MNKKLYMPILASLLAIPSVLAAAPLETFAKFFEDNLKWLAIDLSTNIAGTTGIFWMRVMLWIVLFATFYAVLIGIVPQFKGKRNLSIPVAIVMGIISVIFIPEGIILSIGKAYGIAVSFLLMAIPVGATIYLSYVVFPTGATTTGGKEIATSRRRVNHAIQAILMYLLFVLLTTYTSAIASEDLFGTAATAGTSSFGSLVSSFCIIMMFYHLFAAIFMKGTPSEEGPEGEEGWLMKRAKEAAKEAVGVPKKEKKSEEEKIADLAPLREKMSILDSRVNSFESAAKNFMDACKEYKSNRNPENEAEVFEAADKLKKYGEIVEVAAADVTADPKLFASLEDRDFVQITYIMSRYRASLVSTIGSISFVIG